ncbi:hypothetical protein SAMN04487895_11318 [Paenibacillus sophorae]|uniref:Uncharacterized protein n=1 Tax=Paenibacillus sophorae TaxID=1333845 RepID=A0A1H8T399_9BACL|nr:hypothetical protein [Paenibacillus sophorae]QWU17067.1 hypothetical protein KP014_07820 [Paenibacillus sophorae]SEO85166.1 hypothetical protein SAMN04487895_11318 [Paenibacillus sophorae]
MENKRWRFKVPGASDSKEIIIDTREIKSVYDVLKKLRNAEDAVPLEETTAPRQETNPESPGKPEAV